MKRAFVLTVFLCGCASFSKEAYIDVALATLQAFARAMSEAQTSGLASYDKTDSGHVLDASGDQ